MNLSQLAERLGLPKDSPEATVFEALASRDAEGQKAKKSLEALKGQLPAFGLKLDAAEKLARVEPLKLDLLDAEGDSEETKALKAEVRAGRVAAATAAISSNDEFAKKLAGDLKMPPAMMSLLNEVLNVRGEIECLSLSKDGQVEIKKTADFPKKLKGLLEQLSSFKGVKFETKTEEPKTDEKLAQEERDKDYKEHFSKHTGEAKPEEAAATK